MSTPTRHVLWTGGFDSTFRVCQILAESSDLVQPYYLVDETRKSIGEEIHTMNRIRRDLEKHPQVDSSRLLPTHYASARGRPVPDGLHEAWEVIYQEMDIGKQYPWISGYAQALGEPLELGIQGGGRVEKILRPYLKNGVVKASGKSEFENALIKLFAPFRLPIIHLSKNDMFRISDERGFRAIMERTWFCHSPRRGRPCGRCAPCKYAIEQDMGWRIPFFRRIQHRSFWEHLARSMRSGN